MLECNRSEEKIHNICAYGITTLTLCIWCLLVRGQCHDKLSILSVTVAGSPSGTVRGGGRRPRPCPLSHKKVSVGQCVTESTNCNLLSLTTSHPKYERKEQNLLIYSVRKSKIF